MDQKRFGEAVKLLASSDRLDDVIFELHSHLELNVAENLYYIRQDCTKTATARHILSLIDDYNDSIVKVLLEQGLEDVVRIVSPEDSSDKTQHYGLSQNIEQLPYISSSSSAPCIPDLNTQDLPLLPNPSQSYPQKLNEMGETPELKVNVRSYSDEYEVTLPDTEIYKNSSEPRGYVFIVNYEEFDDDTHKKRTGSQIDVKNLQKLFEQIGYKVMDMHQNLSKNATMKFIMQFRDRPEHKDVDSCIMVFMSHGRMKGSFFTTDNATIYHEDIFEAMNNYNCPNLNNKPKLFIFQHCRGDMKDEGVEIHPVSFENDSESSTEMDGACCGLTRQINKEPTITDMIIIHSTIEGYSSYRDVTRGSWLIEELCKELMENCYRKSLEEMLNTVSQKIRQKSSSDGKKQGIEVTKKSFDRKFYFNPILRQRKTIYDKLDSMSLSETSSLPHVPWGACSTENSPFGTPRSSRSVLEHRHHRMRQWSGASNASSTTESRSEDIPPLPINRNARWYISSPTVHQGGTEDVVDTLKEGGEGNSLFTFEDIPPCISPTKTAAFEDYKLQAATNAPDAIVSGPLKRQLSIPSNKEALKGLNTAKTYLQCHNGSDKIMKNLDDIHEDLLNLKNEAKRPKKECSSLDY